MWISALLLVLCASAATAQLTKPQLKTGSQTTQTQLQTMVGNANDKRELWMRNGTLNPQVLASFPAPARSAYAAVSAIPIYDLRNNKHPQDLLVTLMDISRLNSSVTTALAGLTPVTAPTFSRSLLMHIPLFVFATLRPANLRSIGAAFSTQQKAAICFRLVKEHADAETVRIITTGIDCMPAVVSSGMGPMVKSEIATALLDGVKKRMAPGTWTNTDWGRMLELLQGLTPDDVKMIPNAVLMANFPKVAARVHRLDPRLRQGLFKQMIQAVGGKSRFTGTQIRAILPFLKFMKPSDFQGFPPAVMATIAPHIARIQFGDSNRKSEMAQILIKQMGPPANWTRQQFKDAGPLIKTREYTLSKVNRTFIKDAVMEMGRNKLKPREAAPIVAEMMKDAHLMHPGNWSNATFLAKAKHLLSAVPVHFLKRINGSVLLMVMKDLKDVEFSKSQKRALWNITKQHLPKPLAQMNSTEIEDHKALLEGMSGEEMNRLSPTALRDALGNLGDNVKLGRGRVQSCMNRMNALPGGVKGNVDKLGSFARRVPSQVLKNASASVLGVTGGKQMNTDCDADQCKVLWEKIKQSQGNVSDPNFNPKKIKNFGRAILGLTEDDVKNLPKGRVLMTISEQVCQFAKKKKVPTATLR